VLKGCGIVTNFTTIKTGSPHTLRVQFLPDFGYDKIRIGLASLRTQKRTSDDVDAPPTKRNFIEINRNSVAYKLRHDDNIAIHPTVSKL